MNWYNVKMSSNGQLNDLDMRITSIHESLKWLNLNGNDIVACRLNFEPYRFPSCTFSKPLITDRRQTQPPITSRRQTQPLFTSRRQSQTMVTSRRQSQPLITSRRHSQPPGGAQISTGRA